MYLDLALLLSLSLMVMFLCTLLFSLSLYSESKSYFIELDLVNDLGGVSLQYLLLMDWMSSSFVSVVSLISCIVMLYSISYMKHDKSKDKFIILVLMFIMSMFLMISSPNLFSILLGWDGLGLVSYCLVIYYQNWKSNSAGMVTFLSNRIGDLAILLSICWCMNFGSLNLIMLQSVYMSNSLSTVSFMTILAAMTKSAQIPFSAWLPAAMAAPTPVSSLVHSSTLVTAGVYLLIRFNFLFSLNYYLLVISSLTMLMSGASALFEMDLKKVIALSTLSQLGVMMMILSIGQTELAYFHLMSHALFKSLLFLCAGAYIHSMSEWQDVRYVSSLSNNLPIISFYFSCSSLSLSGFPFMSGFYSKDLIIEYLLMSSRSVTILMLVYTATLATLAYSVRLMYLGFSYKSNFLGALNNTAEASLMFKPMWILFLLSVVGGSVLSWTFFPKVLVMIPLSTKLMVLAGMLTLFVISLLASSMKYLMQSTSEIFYLMWNLPLLTMPAIQVTTNKSYEYLKLMDQGWLELMGPSGIMSYLSKMSVDMDKSNLMNIKQMMFYMYTVLFIMIIWY